MVSMLQKRSGGISSSSGLNRHVSWNKSKRADYAAKCSSDFIDEAERVVKFN